MLGTDFGMDSHIRAGPHLEFQLERPLGSEVQSLRNAKDIAEAHRMARTQ
jgi:hypothetical protein